MELSSALSLSVFVALCFAAASTGAAFKPGAWYDALRKPGWTPPKLAFPIVWSVLYVLIAVSGWRVWEAAGTAAWPALSVWAVSLALNAAWSWIFFGLRRIGWALAEVTVFWLSILATALMFAPIDAAASWMLAPYLLWVGIAAALNAAVWRMNRTPAGAAA